MLSARCSECREDGEVAHFVTIGLELSDKFSMSTRDLDLGRLEFEVEMPYKVTFVILAEMELSDARNPIPVEPYMTIIMASGRASGRIYHDSRLVTIRNHANLIRLNGMFDLRELFSVDDDSSVEVEDADVPKVWSSAQIRGENVTVPGLCSLKPREFVL